MGSIFGGGRGAFLGGGGRPFSEEEGVFRGGGKGIWGWGGGFLRVDFKRGGIIMSPMFLLYCIFSNVSAK